MNPSSTGRPVQLSVRRAVLEGVLRVPAEASQLVLFAHGSGSSRLSPRNGHVAERLGSKGLATLLLDLLTAEEEEVDLQTAEFRFDIALLARRLNEATDWLGRQRELAHLAPAYFGSSTGAAAALIAASERSDVASVVSRGGRPDLAGSALLRVRAPTLLIVGGADTQVLELNQQALGQLSGEARLEVIPGATHLFEEPGALDAVAELAGQWFVQHGPRVGVDLWP